MIDKSSDSDRLVRLLRSADSAGRRNSLAAAFQMSRKRLAELAEQHRIPPPPRKKVEFSDEQDAMLRTLARKYPGEWRLIGEKLGVSAEAAHARYQLLRSRLAAAVGDWDDIDLQKALRAQRVRGRSEGSMRLRLVSLGVRSACKPRPITLGEMASRLDVPLDDLVDAAFCRHLRASGEGLWPDQDWVTTERHVGSWLVSNDFPCGPEADMLWAMTCVLGIGMLMGERAASWALS